MPVQGLDQEQQGTIISGQDGVDYSAGDSEQDDGLRQARPLTFEEFAFRRPPRDVPDYHNFPNHFKSNWLGEAYRETNHYKAFIVEDTKLEAKLMEEVEPKLKAISELEDRMLLEGVDLTVEIGTMKLELDRELYEAYVIMRAHVENDRELFR